MKTTHLIFDLDGTLIDSSEGVIEAVNYAFRQVGDLPPAPDVIRASIGYPLEQLFRETSQSSIPDLYRHFQVRAAESVVGATVPLDGAAETVRELKRRGYRMAIATTKISIHIERIIEKLGWEGLFDVCIGGNEVARVKPAPDAFLAALALMRAPAGEAMVVGDTENDIRAAQAIPIRVVAVTSPYGGHDKVLALKPDHVIDRLPELLHILENGNSRV
jgi:HAD superfamily hydrolase (TIGR01509 family)